MNNTDFQRLLTTNDKALVTELTKNPKKRGGVSSGFFKGRGKERGGVEAGRGERRQRDDGEAGERRKGKGGKGKSKGEGAGEGRAPGASGTAVGSGYRDRATLRREGKDEYEGVAAEWEGHAEVSVEQSKYLGGDLEHTHLVKGLDFALLNKVRTEITKQQRVEDAQQQRVERKLKEKKGRSFETLLGRKVWHSVVETLHPHHSTFSQRLKRMGQAISMGQRIRGAPTVFLPGRMRYEFDTGTVQCSTQDIPRIIYLSKEETLAVDGSKTVASALPETVQLVRESLQRAVEDRKRRKHDKTAGNEAGYAIAQKVAAPPKPKAKDADDIFEGMGGFDTTQVVSKKTPAGDKDAKTAAGKVTKEGKDASRPKASYFDDAGAAKYREAPEGQIDLADMELEEEVDPDAPKKAAAEGAFEPVERFMGPRLGWVFKLGPRGLGYYQEAKAAQVASSSSRSGQEPLRRPKRAAGSKPLPDADGDDAYGECFPEAGLGMARTATGENADSDDEEDGDGKKDKKLKPGEKKKLRDQGPDSVTANQKGAAEAKKRKMNDTQQWQKIDAMIKKGNHKSMEQLESQHGRPGGRNRPPAPREVMSTPAYF